MNARSPDLQAQQRTLDRGVNPSTRKRRRWVWPSIAIGAGVLFLGFIYYQVVVVEDRRNEARRQMGAEISASLERNREKSSLESQMSLIKANASSKRQILRISITDAIATAAFSDQQVKHYAEMFDLSATHLNEESLRIAKEKATRDRTQLEKYKRELEENERQEKTECEALQQRIDAIK